MIIVFLSELSTAFEIAGPSTKPEEAIQRYLELYRESSLANVLSTHQQQKKLNIIADDILSNFLDSTAYACPPLRSFLREILSGIVLESTISNLSRPETINSWIIYLLSEGESGIMSAIDAGVEGARNDGVTTASRCHMDTSLTTSFDSFDLKSKSPIKAYQGGPDYADKATEEAITEAKRLSAMIAAQDLQSQSFDQTTENSSGSQTSQHVDGFSPGSTIDAMKDKPVPEVQRRVEVPEAKMDGTPSQMSIEQGATRESGSSSGLSVRSSSLEQPLLLSSPLTLHRAFVSIHDGSESSEEIILRSKPTSSYLLQIEPSSAPCTGWMVFRNYADFESLHETLEAISRLNKIQQFSDAHSLLPTWKRLTSRALANNLERYLQDALQYEPLAECERMRRFLEKEGPINHETKSSTKSSFFPSQAALENVGKGVLGVLTNAPKSVSGGRNAVFSGMAGVFGAGPSKNTVSSLIPANSNTARFGDSFQIPPGMSGSIGDAVAGPLPVHHESQEHAPTLPESSSTRPSVRGTEHLEESVPIDLEGTTSSATENASSGNDFSSDSDMVLRIHGLSEATQCLDEQWRNDLRKEDFVEQTTTSGRGLSSDKNLSITQDETRVAVELIFAVINELYMLSSAWNIRRTLLNAAKTYMLRPGNPNLETIRGLLQNSMLDANTSDQALARYIVRLRENALPTESELESWPSPPNDAEKERLRQTARRILVQKGLPQTLTGVMGAAASREALEKVFDCLQVQSVAKGFVFSIVVQALKAVTL
ncbi:PX domain protein [Aspergillus tanneri]|uniref:PXA domain-containing protein n=1 Tax=Aspergillus tanneri TaxID=1220188 RepID=A0A5M9MYS0_9EURO|nr:uncharacterized protein ATNIH1004_001195 [Aspergillus tanneri]KAA8652291.1 hypothetical protein ATNIH1004_001195 [Aspergillus tanneri]